MLIAPSLRQAGFAQSEPSPPSIRLLALDHGIGLLTFVVTEDDEVGPVERGAVWHCHFDANAGWLVSIPVDQLGPEFGANLLLGVGVPFGAVDGNVGNLLLFAFARDLRVPVLKCSL